MLMKLTTRVKIFVRLGCTNYNFSLILILIGILTANQSGVVKKLSFKLASFTSREKKRTDGTLPTSPGGVENPDFVP